jgi:hypothetical protein
MGEWIDSVQYRDNNGTIWGYGAAEVMAQREGCSRPMWQPDSGPVPAPPARSSGHLALIVTGVFGAFCLVAAVIDYATHDPHAYAMWFWIILGSFFWVGFIRSLRHRIAGTSLPQDDWE